MGFKLSFVARSADAKKLAQMELSKHGNSAEGRAHSRMPVAITCCAGSARFSFVNPTENAGHA